MHHDEIAGGGTLAHWQIDNALAPAGDFGNYGVDDVLGLEGAMGAPASGTVATRVTWNTYISLYEFPDASARYLQSIVQLPHSYVNGSDLLWHAHFIPTSALTAGQTVTFAIGVFMAAPNAVFPTSGTTYSSTYTAPVGGTAIDTHCKTQSVAIPGAALSGSSFVIARLTRTIADTATADVLLLGGDFHIRKNRIGSAAEYPT